MFGLLKVFIKCIDIGWFENDEGEGGGDWWVVGGLYGCGRGLDFGDFVEEGVDGMCILL